MDWRSKEGRALLRAAYPEGYVSQRGVMTLSGLTMAGNEDAHIDSEIAFYSAVWPFRSGEGEDDDYDWKVLDALLPMPDPADAATWACLLSDLADARYGTQGPRGTDGNAVPCLGRALVQQVRDIVTLGWALIQVYPTKIREDFLPGTYGIADPAEALVRAKIHALECRTKEP